MRPGSDREPGPPGPDAAAPRRSSHQRRIPPSFQPGEYVIRLSVTGNPCVRHSAMTASGGTLSTGTRNPVGSGTALGKICWSRSGDGRQPAVITTSSVRQGSSISAASTRTWPSCRTATCWQRLSRSPRSPLSSIWQERPPAVTYSGIMASKSTQTPSGCCGALESVSPISCARGYSGPSGSGGLSMHDDGVPPVPLHHQTYAFDDLLARPAQAETKFFRVDRYRSRPRRTASSSGAGSKRTGSVAGSPVSRVAASQAFRAASSLMS